MLNQPIVPRHAAQRGFGLIEMMVGITVGLIVVAGASLMMVNQVNEHRRLMLETQVQQDLRAVADLVLRDLRRSGYWAAPQRGIWAPASDGPITTLYSDTTPGDPSTVSEVLYSYSRKSSTDENNTPDANESFGFKLQDDMLKLRLGGAWQPLTDPGTLIVTAFNVTLNVQTVSLTGACEVDCPAGATNCPPVQQVRNFTVLLRGRATHDAAVVRTVRLVSRLRNDRIVGSCPAA